METKHDPIKELKLVHRALCIGASLIIIIVHFSIKPIDLDGIMGSLNVISIVGLILAGLLVLSASYMFNKKSIELGADINSENLNDYRAAYILKWSIIESTILLNAIFYFFLDADPINIIISILLLLVLYFSKPMVV